jgi:hypothetical protein
MKISNFFGGMYCDLYISATTLINQTRLARMKDFEKFNKLNNFYATSHCGHKYNTVAELSLELSPQSI